MKGFTLFVRDEVSMMTQDPPVENRIESTDAEYKYRMVAGMPKMTPADKPDDPPLADSKKITFWVTKDGYLDSDKVTIEVTVLGDVDKGLVGDIISLPTINYLVLHDPPGDGSYSFFDDSLTVSSYLCDFQMEIGRDIERRYRFILICGVTNDG